MAEHEIMARGSTHDLDRDWMRIRIACVVPGCTYGTVEGSPAHKIDQLVVAMMAHHRDELPCPPDVTA